MRNIVCAVAAVVIVFGLHARVHADAPVAGAGHESIQATIDANPGRMILVPEGDHEIAKKLRITTDGAGLCGHGRIVQTNPDEPILEIENAAGVRVKDVAFTRKHEKNAASPGILCIGCRGVVLDGLRVTGHRGREAAIELRNCSEGTVRNCHVIDYQCITVDDRTDSPHYGYAFHCIDGTGILVREAVGAIVQDNRIIERTLIPTPELKAKHQLGTLVEGKSAEKQGALGSDALRNRYVNNWHQGSAIVVTGPEVTHHVIITGNYIENAAQGIDLHADQVVCSNNIVHRGMMGIKATHGSKNLVISGNLLTHIDLWGIVLNPGTASHVAEPATDTAPARPANVDGGTIIANNIISDYGFGNEYWNWGGGTSDQAASYAIALFEGQLPTNPPLTDVLIQGNMVYDTGKEKVVVNGEPQVVPPRYRYAVYVGPWGADAEKGPTYPQQVRFVGNLFHAGTCGASNIGPHAEQ